MGKTVENYIKEIFDPSNPLVSPMAHVLSARADTDISIPDFNRIVDAVEAVTGMRMPLPKHEANQTLARQ